MVVTEGARRAKEENSDRRFFLPQQKLRILWDQSAGDSRAGGVWPAREVRRNPRLHVPGVWKEVYSQEEYDPIPAEESFRPDRKNPVAVGIRCRCSTLEEVFGVREITIRTRLCRSGMQGKKLHERFMTELELVHIQLDELWANLKNGSQEMWVWIASDAKTKIIPVMQVGGRSQEAAYLVVHELKRRLKSGCVPVSTTDGLRHYFYALTAHFGRWESADGKKRVWVLLGNFVYGQIIKHQRRRKTVEVERRVLIGERTQYSERLCQAGLSGQINTSFVERVNLTIRQCVSKLTRRTWGPAKSPTELLEHLEW